MKSQVDHPEHVKASQTCGEKTEEPEYWTTKWRTVGTPENFIFAKEP